MHSSTSARKGSGREPFISLENKVHKWWSRQTVGGPLEYDHEDRSVLWGLGGRSRPLVHILSLGSPHCRHPLSDGRTLSFPSYSQVTSSPSQPLSLQWKLFLILFQCFTGFTGSSSRPSSMAGMVTFLSLFPSRPFWSRPRTINVI